MEENKELTDVQEKGKMIKEMRLKFKILQTECAEKMGVSVGTWKRWENGKGKRIKDRDFTYIVKKLFEFRK
jgi:DNA-binding transcriptional regulator YiaG